VQWRLVDEAVPKPSWEETVAARAAEFAARSSRPAHTPGIVLSPVEKNRADDAIEYPHVGATIDRATRSARITVHGPDNDAPDRDGIHDQGAAFYPLALTRELDDVILDLRTNEPEIGTWVLTSTGDTRRVLGYDRLLLENLDDWLVNEIVQYYKRTLKRLDVTSRSLIALIEPGSCFAGSLLELALAADQAFQLAGVFEDADPNASPASIVVDEMNLGPLPMGNGLTRLQTRFLGEDDALAEIDKIRGDAVLAEDAERLGLVTFAPDDIDWAEEVRIAVEERASFSPDALTGLEANYRFAGPETMETKIFGRLTAWQNWIFTRPNASGPDGALRRFGTGQRAEFDRRRV
jgi:benzoyl-CoA-dihydrodiol lyase